MLRLADVVQDVLRRVGDLVVAAFFEHDKPRARNSRVEELADRARQWLECGDGEEALGLIQATLRTGERGVPAFHWEIEFPEVFERENGGLDAIVGNPPFEGKNSIAEGHRESHPDWLKQAHEESHGNADLVAHFFRRAFGLLRQEGAFGLIATNTIARGDTRSTGLRWVCKNGGTIYAATRRLRWPGQAAVVVSLVHVAKGARAGPFDLDGREVPAITAFLFHAGGHDDPARLAANANRSFQGSIVLGMGFTFDDTDRTGAASPLSEMRALIAKDSRNAERIFPYIGGEEVNDSPTHAHHRYVINFGTMTEEEARRWPCLMQIVEERVKPQRLTDKRDDGRGGGKGKRRQR